MRLGRKKGSKFAFIFFLIVLVFLVLRISLSLKMESSFSSAVSEYATQNCIQSLNYAINELMADNDVSYSDLISITKDNEGKIISMSADGLKISSLKSKISTGINDYLEKESKKEIFLPAGTVLHSPMFSGLGPDFKFKIKPTAVTKVDFRDQFTNAGINQVRHTIYLDVDVEICITSSSSKINENVSTSILVSDTVLVGDVPTHYACIDK